LVQSPYIHAWEYNHILNHALNATTPPEKSSPEKTWMRATRGTRCHPERGQREPLQAAKKPECIASGLSVRFLSTLIGGE
ncbi:MAG: hypothetical protein RI567_14065, partial [Marinobacter sp.]|nr:hypothetical protein [Marinobacter sp.]